MAVVVIHVKNTNNNRRTKNTNNNNQFMYQMCEDYKINLGDNDDNSNHNVQNGDCNIGSKNKNSRIRCNRCSKRRI